MGLDDIPKEYCDLCCPGHCHQQSLLDVEWFNGDTFCGDSRAIFSNDEHFTTTSFLISFDTKNS